jgi:hypothetical protein
MDVKNQKLQTIKEFENLPMLAPPNESSCMQGQKEARFGTHDMTW